MHSEIRDSVPCTGCSYDLKGLAPDGVCPECGERIALTLPPCPRCAATDSEPAALTRLPRDRVGTWKCPRCGGVGFERDRLRAAVSKLRPLRHVENSAVFDLVAQSPVACTRCRAGMESIVIDKRTIIDRCAPCGFIWLDPGELPALAAYLKRHLGGATPPRQLEEMLGDPWKIAESADRGKIDFREWDDLTTVEMVVAIISWLFS